ncbi:MAG: hypothetical protein M1821_002444 [Bathelium mastoideum]|nr:MAG: hypothetical protein M1821_002444 [Bathelium mastoideum]
MVGLAEVLQKHMASPNDATVSLGATALHFAVIGGKTDAANYLIQRGAKVHLQDDNGLTPIQAAWELILEGRFSQDTTTGLKDAFPECSSFPTFDFSDLHKAVVGLLPVRPELMLLRPTWRTQVDFVDAWGRTPLHWAVKKGDVLTTESLIRACSNVNIQDKEGMTALHVAAGRPAILKTLIEAGANTCLRNKGGAQAIHWASMASAESIRLLLEADDCVETKDDRGGTPLGWSICSTNIDCCKYLIKRGANINYVDENNGDSSIFTAVSSQAYDCLKMLLACDIDILHINNSGSTILHWIARNGDNCTLDIVDGKVSKFGSLNTSHKDRAGKTAREVAQTRVGCPAGFVEHFLKMVDDIENMQANGAVFTNSGIPNQTDEGSGIHQTRVSRNKGLVGSCLVAGIALFAAALFLILEWARSRFF